MNHIKPNGDIYQKWNDWHLDFMLAVILLVLEPVAAGLGNLHGFAKPV